MRKFQVCESSVFWWMKSSEFLQNTGGRERGRGLLAEGTMRSPVVVVKTPTDNHPASALQPEGSVRFLITTPSGLNAGAGIGRLGEIQETTDDREATDQGTAT